MRRVLVLVAAFFAAAEAASVLPYVILTPDYGPQRRNDGPEPDKIMVAWPSGVRLPSRQVPLRFVAAMAVPVNTDPLLTQKELSEVVYYSSMDLRKLNNTRGSKDARNPQSGTEYYLEETGDDDEEDDEYYYEDTTTNIPSTVTPFPFVTASKTLLTSTVAPTPKSTTIPPSPTTPPTRSTTPRIRPTTAPFLPTVPTEDVREIWTTSASATTAVRRAWTPNQTARREDEWSLEAESVAYIVVGTCCGLSVLTLAIVLLVFKMRRSPQPPRTESTSDVSSERSVGESSLHLPQRLINLMNSHSQSASTHKLGSWFNGRPTALSIHGQGMAFPNTRVHNASLNMDAPEFEEFQVGNDVSMDRPDSLSGSHIEDDSLQRRNVHVEELLEELDEAGSSSSAHSSRHNTFIFWSSNSDRLV